MDDVILKGYIQIKCSNPGRLKRKVCFVLFQIFNINVPPCRLNIIQIEKMRKKDLEIMVIGDFNFDSNSPSCLIQYFSSLELKQIVSGPTFVRGPNTIDHIYIPNYLVENYKMLSRFNYYSDHSSFNVNFE